MKGLIIRLIVLLGGLTAFGRIGAEALPSNSAAPVLRVSFPGFNKIEGSADGVTLQEVRKIPASVALRETALNRLGSYIVSKLGNLDSEKENQVLNLIRPLLGDLFQEQTYIEIRDQDPTGLHWTLAVNLDEARRRFWKTNCSALLESLTPAADQSGPFAAEAINSWFILSGPSPSVQDASGSNNINPLVDRIRRDGHPGQEASGDSLFIEADLSKLRTLLPRLIPAKLSRLTANVRGRESSLKTEIFLRFSEPIDWQLESWKIPLNTIRDSKNSLMSFTAVQGIRPWLKARAVANQLGIDPLPNQLFAWGQSFAPYQIQAAVPVSDASAEIETIARMHLSEWNKTLAKNSVGSLEKLMDGTGILWKSLPILTPYVQISHESQQDFLLGGIFPVPPSANPPPSELIRELTDRDNLLYYDWEITQARLVQLRSLIPLLSIVTTLPALPPSSLAGQWLGAIEPKLGNTVTEISVSGPNTISVLRTSHLGFNGLELIGLAYWLDSPAFPRATTTIGFRPVPGPNQ
ncbi:MAG: hypothetical protein O2960_08300 [Verrucomicrobia bacterium]|nr:hypothetical protein [Verrucomicrobiota bacterium]